MKKRILIIISALLVLFMILSAVGCGADDQGANNESTTIGGGETDGDGGTTGNNDNTDDSGNTDSGNTDSGNTDDGGDTGDGGDTTPDNGDDVDDTAPAPDSWFKNTTYNLATDEEHFKLYGRMQKVSSGVTCDLTASGIEFSGTFTGSVNLTLNASADTYFTVYIDGVRSETRFYAKPGLSTLKIADFAETGQHTIRVLKQSELQRSYTELRSVRINGKLDDAPAAKKVYIEVIGDSITCGYGNLCTKGTADAGTALYEDGTQAFPFMTAEALGADYSIMGCSGVGIDKGWTAFSESDFYPQWSYYRDKTGNPYDFSSARVPNLVIINLGTNDVAKGSTEETFKEKAKALIEYIRTAYGKDVNIIWTHDMMGESRATWVKDLFAGMGGESAGLYSVTLNTDKTGGGSHPSIDGHKTATEILTAFINEKNLLPK